jgi:hypothetical protein
MHQTHVRAGVRASARIGQHVFEKTTFRIQRLTAFGSFGNVRSRSSDDGACSATTIVALWTSIPT